MKGTRLLVSLLLIFTLVLPGAVFAQGAVKVTVHEGIKVYNSNFDSKILYNPIIIYNNTLYLPLDESLTSSFGLGFKRANGRADITFSGTGLFGYRTASKPHSSTLNGYPKNDDIWINGRQVDIDKAKTPLLRVNSQYYLPLTKRALMEMHWQMNETGTYGETLTIPTPKELAAIRASQVNFNVYSQEIRKRLCTQMDKLAVQNWFDQEQPLMDQELFSDIFSIVNNSSSIIEKALENIVSKLAKVLQQVQRIPDREASETAYEARSEEIMGRLDKALAGKVFMKDGREYRAQGSGSRPNGDVVHVQEYSNAFILYENFSHKHCLAWANGTEPYRIRETDKGTTGWTKLGPQLYYGDVDGSVDPEGFGVLYEYGKATLGTFDNAMNVKDPIVLKDDGTKWIEWEDENKIVQRLTITPEGKIEMGPVLGLKGKNGTYFTTTTDLKTITMQEYINDYPYPITLQLAGDRIQVTSTEPQGLNFVATTDTLYSLYESVDGKKDGGVLIETAEGIRYWGQAKNGRVENMRQYSINNYSPDQLTTFLDKTVQRAFDKGASTMNQLKSIVAYMDKVETNHASEAGYQEMYDTGLGA